MSSSHHPPQYSRYSSIHPPPPPPQDSSLRLPSLKDLNFPYRSPHHATQDSPALSAHPASAPIDVSPNPPDHPARHVQSWARSNPPPSVPQPIPPQHQHPHQHQHQHPHHPQHPHQQHTPPLSAGHEVSAPKVDYSSKVDYPPKHENGGYAHPGIPMSAQMASTVNQSRAEESAQSPGLAKRSRPASSNMTAPRDVRPPHNTYPPQYASYPPSQPPPASPHYQISPSVSGPPSTHPGPPPHTPDQIQQHTVPVSTHPAYGGYHAYVQPRPAAISQHPQHSQHSQHPQHPPHQPPQHNNPYPSPGPPPSAPPPQGPWVQHHQPPPHHPQHTPVAQPQAPPPQSSAPPQQQQLHQQHPPPQSQPQSSQPPPPPQPQPQPTPSHPHSQPQPLQHPQPQPHHPHHPQHPQQQHVQHPASVQTHPTPPSAPSQTQAHLVPQQQQHPQQQQQQQQQQHHHHQQQQQQHSSQVAQPTTHPSQSASHHPVQQQHPQLPFGRTTALVPTPVEARAPYSGTESERAPSTRNDTVAEILKHCTALYTFASRYAHMQASIPNIQPSAEELAEMSQRAATVVRLLEEFRRMNLPELERVKVPTDVMNTSPDDPRPPKRPWEDMSQSGGAAPEPGPLSDYPAATGDKTTAEQDMEIIRTKRATSTAGGNGTSGQPKSKYRKRSRATPPGKCHSCNIRETPEWRRGPDGARTLCNACGLHYAKLMRKKDKAGEAPVIDMETLRASAKAAENLRASTKAADLADRIRTNSKNRQNMDTSSSDSGKQQQQPPPQQVHQSSFQVVPMMPSEPAPQPIASEPRNIPPPPASHSSVTSGPIPPPPWSAPASGTNSSVRPYSDHLQHQSFMRTSQHPSVTQASPR